MRLIFRGDFFTVSFKKHFSNITDKTIIYSLFASIFLPFYITAIIIIASCFYIILKKRIVGAFEKNGSIWVILFAIYLFAVSIINFNFIGLGCGLFFIGIIIIAKFIRKHITAEIFEKGLDITCIMAVITAFVCLIDFIYHQFILSSKGTYRSTLYFGNSNYLATLFATVIVICGYKLLNHYRKSIIYYVVALFCAIGAYFTGSMFVWVEVFIGCSALLLLTRRHQMLSALFLLAGTFIIVLYCMPDIMPRINESNITTDNRITIWSTTLKAIKDATPFLGKGFMAYYHIMDLYPGSYYTGHSHSIFLEPILDFGIIGTLMLVVYFCYFYKRVTLCKNAQHKFCISSLIIAFSLAIVVHGTTDLTFIWIQTGLFYALIFASIGIEEKLLKID